MSEIEIGSPEFQKLSPAQRLILLRAKEKREKQRKDENPKNYLTELKKQREILRSDYFDPNEFSIYAPFQNSSTFQLSGPENHPFLGGQKKRWLDSSERASCEAKLDRGRQLNRIEQEISQLEQEIIELEQQGNR
jgi:hypothetical protein